MLEGASEEMPQGRPEAKPVRGNVMAFVVLALAVLALSTPFLKEEFVGERLGALLVAAGLLHLLHGFRRSTSAGQRSAWLGGGFTLAMGLLLVNASLVAASALVIFFAFWFGLDGLRFLVSGWRRRLAGNWLARAYALAAGVANLLVCVALMVFRGQEMPWTLAWAAFLRLVGAALDMFFAPVLDEGEVGASALGDLQLPDDPETKALAERIAEQEAARAAVDRGWIVGFVFTLFAIHLSRMGFDRTALGVLSPCLAVMGDIFMGLLIALLVFLPLTVLSLRLTRRLERRGWLWVLKAPRARRGLGRRALQAVLVRRLRGAVRLRSMRLSLRSALHRALQTGLPVAAVIAAIVPLLGMSWYFNTESWAAGVWDSWAAHRTDGWREAMALAALAHGPPADPAGLFAVRPPGIGGGKDFAFLVIGDTGEGDASQHSLRAAYLDAVKQDEVKFVIVSSDVVYPTGAMRDYERCFWLPFMGTAKPVYAIPGNHDWYDALEGFVATFFEPEAARRALRARVDADKGITGTTEEHIERLIAEASRLRKEYRVPTQLQQVPYFQLQTDSFALFAIDTGVVKRLDATQLEWLKRALEAARGKSKMAILGHPLFAGGRSMSEGLPEFAILHELLREQEVAIAMGGDTHDLEHYVEELPGGRRMIHFVNGGGGAYLSYGTSLDWPKKPATKTWAFYPPKPQVMAKIEATTPWWKWPAWWWTKRMGGWPFSAEFLSAAFDANVAPFYQSFMVVHVEPSKGRIRLVPYGVHGRLRWSEFERSADLASGTMPPEELVEWIVEMKKTGPKPQ